MSLKLIEKTYGDVEVNSMIDVLNSDQLTMGKKVYEFENEFAKKFNFNYCVMVNSGSSANLLAMSVLSNPVRKKYLKPGDRILVPSVCWATSVYPIVQNNLIPIFMDVNEKTLNINAEDIEKYENIQGIVLVHILGNCTNMEKVMEIVKKKNLIVMEDTCESLSSKYDNCFLGGFGDMGTFSFYFSHHITTIEGGMICCKTEEDYELLKCLRAHGWTRNSKSQKDYENINSKFCFINFGYNFRPMETQAAMGLIQLNLLDNKNYIRRENYKNITDKLLNDPRNINIFTIAQCTDKCDAMWFSIVLFLSDKYKIYIKDFLKYLDDNNIENRPVVTGNFLRQPVIKLINENINPEVYVGAEKIHFNGFYIGCPTFKIYTNDEIDCIVNKFYSFNKFNTIIPFFDSPYNIENSIPYVNDAIRSTWISIEGKYINECENRLKKITGCEYIILTLTGSAAIHCMIKCLKYKFPNCKKIYIPNNTYIACINMLLHEYDITQIECVDVDINTLNFENFENFEKNSAIFVIHNIAGITNVPRLKRERPDLIIFEDNSEGYFGKYENKPTGSESVASCLSFNMNKNFTSGQGGAFCTNDKELYQYISSYTRHGFTGEKFNYKMIGNNYRMTNITAAVLLSQIEQEDLLLDYKKNIYNTYKKNLLNNKKVSIQKINDDTTSSYWNVCIRIHNNKNYNEIKNILLKYNIESRPMFLPINKFDYLKNLKHTENTNSIQINNEYILLPSNKLTYNIIEYICKTIEKNI